ncbi:MAG TPA: hypothetical protein DCY07_08825, partial [Rhodospirillaceae bacterium]|nr:hypothetical protein [Rhodospirillaceae bacterium]
KAHGAEFNCESFSTVVSAICSGKIQAHIVGITYADRDASVGIENDVAGAMIALPSVYSKWDESNQTFVNVPATYIEDTFVFKDKSQKFRETTKNKDTFPEGISLGTFFHAKMFALSMSDSAHGNQFGQMSSCYIAEHGENNAPMLRIYKNLNATRDDSPDANILLFTKPPSLVRKSRTTTYIESLGTSARENSFQLNPHIFLSSWSHKTGNKRIQASFTDSLSTFTGKSVIRVQITSNGNLPDEQKLKDVLDDLLKAGLSEVSKRGWMPSPVQHDSLRIHALNEPEIASALRSMGAETRVLGKCPMKPVVIDYKDLPDSIFGENRPTVTPFYVYSVQKADLRVYYANDNDKGAQQSSRVLTQPQAYSPVSHGLRPA